MGAAEEPVHLAGATAGEHRHICAFFNNAAEEYRVLPPFIKEGLARGDPGLRDLRIRSVENPR